MMRSTITADDNHHSMEDESCTSASLSLSGLSLFATQQRSTTGGSESVISSSAGGSIPHTPPSASPSSRAYLTSKSGLYNYPPVNVHSTAGGFDATSKTEEDEIILGYTPNYPVTITNRLGTTTSPSLALQPNASKFSVQRSTILKINALTGTGNASPRTRTRTTPLLLSALLNPSHHPRSLWTLASHIEDTDGCEPFVWAIFDSHEHALSALSALSVNNNNAAHHLPIAEPALESDLHPFSKLRKVDMKVWAANMAALEHSYPPGAGAEHSYPPSVEHSYPRGAHSPGAEHSFSPGAYSPMQRYSPTDAYAYSYSPQNISAYSPINAYSYSPQNTYPPALYHQSTYHHNHTHTHQPNSTESQEITTPIPLPMQPKPQSHPNPQHQRLESESTNANASASGFDDHPTPIPPSHTPYAPAPHTYTSSDEKITYTPHPYPSEMNSRKHHTDVDGGVNFYETGRVNLDGTGGLNLDETRAGDEKTSAEAQKTPHSVVAASRSPITVAVAAVAGSRSLVTVVAAESRSPITAAGLLPGVGGGGTAASLLPNGGSGAEFSETEVGQDVDGQAQGALKRQFGTRDQWGGRASESENMRGGEREAETTRSLERNTDVQVPWKEGPKGNEKSILDRDLDDPRESSHGSGPGAGLAPSSSSFSFGTSFVPDHQPALSNFTSHVTRPDLTGDLGAVDVDLVGAKKIEMLQMPQLGTGSPGREVECIEKTEWTATAGVYPKQQPKLTPAETSFSPLPFPSNNDCDRDCASQGPERRLLPPDQSSSSPSPSYSSLAVTDTRRAPDDGDRFKPNFTPPSPKPSANAHRIGGSNACGAGASVGGGYGSLGRFSPMLDRPIQSRGVGEDEGYVDDERDEMLGRSRACLNYHVEDAACSLQSSAPPSHQTLQQFRQRDPQKQPFFHEQPPHSLSFFHQNQNQAPNPNQNQNQQYQHQQQQQQHVYPAATYAHTNLGVAPPTAFRHGDWLCNMPGCGAHNFGRNVSCIMCGAERATSIAAGAGLGFGYAAAAAGTGRMQSSGGLSMGMGMTMDGASELDGDYAYALAQGGANAGMGTGANAVGLNHGRLPTSNTFSSQPYSLGHASTHIPVIPRFGGQHYNVGAPQTTNGDIAMNSTLVQALGGISQVAAIQEAIKAHQSQMQPQGRLGGANNVGFAGQRHSNNATFSMPPQEGQLLIPTTLGNSPPTSLPQGPIVVQQGRGARFGEARDGQGRNPNLMVPGMQHHGPPSMPSQYSQQGHPMQHPLPPHPGISASLLNSFSSASAALAAAAIPASKMPALLTPSGRKFAAGGRVQNISRDELNPLLMFWPDNEPLPLTSQIRPPAAVLMALGGVQGPPPPILNTGNKGPIDAQPGDWTCGKCDYLNWRRRRVCANCFPHAEGNTEGTKHSTNDVQERVALLASVIFQQQQQVQAQQRQIQSHQATAAAFASPPRDSISQPGNAFVPASSFVPPNSGSGMPSQPQSYAEAPRRNDAMPLSKMDSMSMQLLAQKYGYAVPPPSGLRSATSASSFEQPLLPLNLPPRMTQPSASEGIMSRGFMDLNRNAPSFQPIRADGVPQFDGLPQRLRSSPPSSRSSFSIGSNSSFYKSANEPTPSPLPLLPAFLQEVVGETSESSSSSVHESPSPPSPSSTSSAFGNTYSGDTRLSELVGAGLRRRERSSPTSGAPQLSNNIHRTASHSSIWSFGYPGDRKEGIRPV